MSVVEIEDPEVSMARYHDRYMATLRGQYEAGVMEGKARFLQKIREQNDAMQEKDRLIAEKDRLIAEKDRLIAEKNREIEELKARIKVMRESMKEDA